MSKTTIVFLIIVSCLAMRKTYDFYQKHSHWNQLEIQLALVEEGFPPKMPNRELEKKYRREYYIVIGNGDSDVIMKTIKNKIISQKENTVNLFKNDPDLFSYTRYFAKERDFGSPMSRLNGKHVEEYLFIDEMIICYEKFEYKNNNLIRVYQSGDEYTCLD
jgi:hypothetical protein